MGIADLIPGVSGGTIAFITGIYEDLLQGIQSFSPKALLRLQFGVFFKQIRWKFLLPLIIGIASAFALFAPLFSYLLNHESYYSYLYAAFFGLILASILTCTSQVKAWQTKHIAFFFIAALFAFAMTYTPIAGEIYSPTSVGLNPFLILCGIFSASAMLLPGISGSYILAIIGVYPFILQSLTNFIQGVKGGLFAVPEFYSLLSLALGMLIGFAVFSRVITFLFKRYYKLTLSILTGFMLGALRRIWPFWETEAGEVHLHLIEPILPSQVPWLCVIITFFCFIFVYLIEKRVHAACTKS